jgi:phosphatidate cytidylyltransferase
MNEQARERLFGYELAFDHPLTLWLTVAVGAVLLLAVLVIALLSRSGRVSPALRRELWLRTRSWVFLILCVWLPVLAGAFWAVLALLLVSLWCWREYSRATGLFREHLLSAVAVLAILLLYFAVLDHWYNFFMALAPLGLVSLAIVTIPLDRPQGYIQRVGLALFGYLLLGVAWGHLAYMTNDWDYRPLVLLVLVAVALSDVAAFTSGRLFGRRKLLPETSPNKTVAGALGAILLSTLFVAAASGPLFAGTAIAGWGWRLLLGFLVGALAQLGDLMLSSIKRDLGIKDMGRSIPGHGGMLDRVNSLLLVAPAVFHFVGYFNGIGDDQPFRILTEGGLL